MLSISMLLLLASCSPMVDARGHSGDDEDLKQIVTGQTTRDDVTALLGSPTTTASFGDETWYYITQVKERVGMLAPEVADQQVIAITFDANQVVTSVERYTKEQGKPVQMVSKTTPTEGHSFTMIEQLLGNLGRFNAPGRGMSQRNMGR